MSEAMQRQTGPTPAWLLFSGVAFGVVGASVNKHAENVGELVVALRGRTENSDAPVAVALGQMGLAAACCCRSRGASWAGSDCPRRPTQTTPRKGSSTLLSCLWPRDVGSPLVYCIITGVGRPGPRKSRRCLPRASPNSSLTK